MTSGSESGSWSRENILWIQVAAFLRHATVSDVTIHSIRTQLFNPRLLQSVNIHATDQGVRVAGWLLTIDWARHAVLLSAHSTVNTTDFSGSQVAFGVAEIIEMIEEHFTRNGGIRGWGFVSTLDFSRACSLIGVAQGGAVADHPSLRRVGGLRLPGLAELSLEVYGVD
ncbi:hypothetical protein GALL_291920 [mine drainage metagenome]|uniref:Uncharacterized protein n=1 Tax=mine drainage metagenome TaxID=410659 RepID=A0A1J5R084_9ZZZZ